MMEAARRLRRRHRAPHRALRRRGAPLQQGAAGRLPPLRRERRHRAHRRHHREPLLRAQRAPCCRGPRSTCSSRWPRSDLRRPAAPRPGRRRARPRRARPGVPRRGARRSSPAWPPATRGVAYNLLEPAAEAVPPGRQRITRELVREGRAARARALRQGGEEHYNLISALHKSMRNSDPDAGLYWLARMLEGGADPPSWRGACCGWRPRTSAWPTRERSSRSPRRPTPSSTWACPSATSRWPRRWSTWPRRQVQRPVPRLREARRRWTPPALPGAAAPAQRPHAADAELGYGDGYVYAHDRPGKVADMACLPPELARERLFEPGEEGWEKRIRERLAELAARRRR